jgi:hypothetical protein
MIKKFFIIICLIINTHSSYSIQVKTVHALTVFTGVTTLVTSFALCKIGKITSYPFITSSLLSAGVTGISYYLLYQQTPEGRLEKSRSIIERISRSSIASENFKNQSMLFDTLQSIYINDELWLMVAFNDIVLMHKDMENAFELLVKVRKEALENYIILQQCDLLHKRALEIYHNIKNTLKVIKNSQEYKEQLKLYQKMIFAEKKLRMQQEITWAEKRKARAQEKMADSQNDMAEIKAMKTILRHK